MSTSDFEIESLRAPYDRGRLVPFIGSGMSIPACVSWQTFVDNLCTEAKLAPHHSQSPNLIARAHMAVARLRTNGQEEFANVVDRSLWQTRQPIPRQSELLAAIYWPIVCSTNYEDLYFRAVVNAGRPAPKVVGRGNESCRRVLGHMAFHEGEMLWMLQGFLGSTDVALADQLKQENTGVDELRRELVVGHSEYRMVAHRLPHFRRTFSHLFRTRSLIFLGSGLADPYFMSLFDEIIELTGPPESPHYALLPESSVDTSFLRSQYHILCRTYPKDQHEEVSSFLHDLSQHLSSRRSRVSTWGFRTDMAGRLDGGRGRPQFEVVAAALPDPATVPDTHAVAISSGRDGSSPPGIPLLSEYGQRAIGHHGQHSRWQNDYVLSWNEIPRAYGIVARELPGRSSRDRRSPSAIRTALASFLDCAQVNGIQTAHIQLLAAGSSRVFPPWVALAQMARAVGDWTRRCGDSSLRVRVYVVDPSVRSLLEAGQLNLLPELDGAPMPITVELLLRDGTSEQQFLYAHRSDYLSDLARRIGVDGSPSVRTRPAFRLRSRPAPLNQIGQDPVEEHLLAGSTLTFDFR